MKIYESLFGYELKNSSFKVYNFLESTYYWTDIATVKLSTIAKRCNLSVNTAQRTTNQYKIKRLSGRFITIERDLLYHKNMDITSFVIFCAISMDKNNDKHAKSFTSISKLTKITGITRSTIVKKVRTLTDNGYIDKQQYISKYGDFGNNNYTLFNVMLRRIWISLLAKINTVQNKIKTSIVKFKGFLVSQYHNYRYSNIIIIIFKFIIYIKTCLFDRLKC